MARFRIRRNEYTIASVVGDDEFGGLVATVMLAVLSAVTGPVTIEQYDAAKHHYYVVKPTVISDP